MVAVSDEYHRSAKPGNFFAANMWPDQPAVFRPVWERYYGEMEGLSATLNADIRRRSWHGGKILRRQNQSPYLELQRHPLSRTAEAARCPVNCGPARTPITGSLTIVKPDNAPGGLQVMTKEGSWMDVPNLEEGFVVNLGDLMAEWTNDRWVSTMHRVVNPPRGNALGSRRLSMTFFHQPTTTR